MIVYELLLVSVLANVVMGVLLWQHQKEESRLLKQAGFYQDRYHDLLGLKHAQREADRFHDLHQAEAREHENTKKQLADLKAQLNQGSEKC